MKLTDKRFWLFGILMTISYLFHSCGFPYCKKVPFSNEDLEWMVPYSVDDTLFFTSKETNRTDTIIIIEKNIHNPSNTCIFDLEGCNWMEGDNHYNAVASYQFSTYHNGVKYTCLFTLKKECDLKPATISMGFLGQYTKKDISCSSLRSVDNSSLPNKFKDFLIVDSSNLDAGKNQPVSPVSEIYWSRQYGLIGYQIYDSTYVLHSLK